MRSLILALMTLLLFGCNADPAAKLHRAAGTGMTRKMETMIKEGADVNAKVDGRTPLMWAFKKGQAKAAALLIESGADINAKNDDGQDLWDIVWDGPAHSTAQGKCLSLIIDRGFKPKAELIEVVKSFDSKELVIALTKAGQDLEQRDENGWTPLHHAAKVGHESSTEALLEAGADPNAESTKIIEKHRPREDGSSYVSLRYEAGTRPADIAELTAGRGQKTCSQLVSEYGGSKNEKIDNVYFDH